jgi:hypothetical protein
MATAPLLIDQDEYKAIKSINSTTSDSVLEEICDGVSQLVKTYCNNSFVDYFTVNKVEPFTLPYQTHLLQLTESPVRTITLVQERASIGGTYTSLTAADYVLDSTTDTLYRIQSGNYKNWAMGPAAVQVSYKAGYDADPVASVTPLPKDLRLAVVDLVTYYFKDQTKSRQTMAGASIQNETSTSQRNNVSFPDHIKRILDLYKNY